MQYAMRRVLVAAVLSAAIGPRLAWATSDSTATAPLDRQLGSHRFMGAIEVPNPFLSSYVTSSTGMANTVGREVSLYNFDDPPVLVEKVAVDLSYLSQQFAFQKRVGRDVALRLSLAGSGRLGTETAALLTEGVSVIMGGSAGGTVRLSERPGFRLAGSLDVSANSLTIVSPRSAIEDILANGLTDTTRSMTEEQSNLRATTGLRAAWGLSTMTGCLLFGDVGIQEPYDEQDPSEVYWQAGGALSLDMRERWGHAVGFMLNTNYRSTGSRNEDLGSGGWSAGLGVFYTGRPELTMGIQTEFTQAHQTTVEDRFKALGLALVLRYDFS